MSSYSVGWPRCELIYQCSVMRNATNCAFCKYVWQSSDMLYCDSCVSCKNCFGCIGLRHKENCILNKQYTKPEYENLKQKVIAHMQKTNEWGKFFPSHIGPFAYNESAAQNFFPLTKEEALSLGYKWREEDKKDYIAQTMAQIPDNIKDCEKCGKNYKIIPQELKFYKTLNLPLPHLCSTCRHAERFTARNTYIMYDSTCSNCKSPIKTTYNPENNEIVFCEKTE